MSLRLSIFVAVFFLLLQPAAAQQSRVALVIGNARYAEAPLKNPVNDARAMAAALRARGFEVLIRENATKQQMEAAVADFGEKLNENATGLFFYAGHGIQVQGRNYLMPVDARIVSEQRIRLEAFDVEAVLDQMQAARSKVSMLILDACRNNPFERRFRSTGSGLAQINAPEGTLIAYATAPGKVAADGDGTNGLYTQEFLKALGTPGLKVEDVFKQVRINVSRASDGLQVPWEASSLTGDFYFVPPAPATATPSLDRAFWEAIKGNNTPAVFQAYLDAFPAGAFAPEARARMAALGGSSMPVGDSRPPGPVTTAPIVPAPAPKPVQQAALPPAGAPLSAPGKFDGLYVATSSDARGVVTSTIEISDATISGFSVNQGAGGVCRATGSIEPATGEVRLFQMNCPNNSLTYTGRFTGGDTELATRATIRSGEHTTLWKKTQSAVQRAALAPAGAPLPAGAIDGRYIAVLPSIDGLPMTMTIDVANHRITGWGTAPSITGVCRLFGTVDASGVIQRLEMDCRLAGWNFFGKFAPTADGSYTAETEARSPTMGNRTIVWKKVSS